MTRKSSGYTYYARFPILPMEPFGIFSLASLQLYHRTPVKMSEAAEHMVAYTKLNDNVYHQILQSTDDNLKPAREILEKIERRELPRFLGQINLIGDVTLDKVCICFH